MEPKYCKPWTLNPYTLRGVRFRIRVPCAWWWKWQCNNLLVMTAVHKFSYEMRCGIFFVKLQYLLFWVIAKSHSTKHKKTSSRSKVLLMFVQKKLRQGVWKAYLSKYSAVCRERKSTEWRHHEAASRRGNPSWYHKLKLLLQNAPVTPFKRYRLSGYGAISTAPNMFQRHATRGADAFIQEAPGGDVLKKRSVYTRTYWMQFWA